MHSRAWLVSIGSLCFIGFVAACGSGAKDAGVGTLCGACPRQVPEEGALCLETGRCNYPQAPAALVCAVGTWRSASDWDPSHSFSTGACPASAPKPGDSCDTEYCTICTYAGGPCGSQTLQCDQKRWAKSPYDGCDAGTEVAKPPSDGGVRGNSQPMCGQNQAWDGDRCYFIRETPRLHCLPASSASTQYTWQEYAKGYHYWFMTVSHFANSRQFSAADHNTGRSTFTCESPSMEQTLACLVDLRNGENSDCLEASALGTKCIALWGLTDICGRARLSLAHFPQGTEDFDEVWRFIKDHAETNDSYDPPP